MYSGLNVWPSTISSSSIVIVPSMFKENDITLGLVESFVYTLTISSITPLAMLPDRSETKFACISKYVVLSDTAKSRIISRESRILPEKVKRMLDPFGNLEISPPLNGRDETGLDVEFFMVKYEELNEFVDSKSDMCTVSVPTFRSRSKDWNTGGSLSDTNAEALRAFPSVIANKSTPWTSSIAYACMVSHVLLSSVAKPGMSRMRNKSCVEI